MTSLALVSDIHGNLPAFEAVVADIRARSPDAVYVLGDIVHGCPWSAEVLDLLGALGWPTLMGNHDDAVLQLGVPRMEPRYADCERYAMLWWTRATLSAEHIRTLTDLPLAVHLDFPAAPPLYLFHGVPGKFSVGFRPDSPEGWIARHLAGVAEETVAGGHTHEPMVRFIDRRLISRGLTDRWTVINSGSVGASYDGDVRAAYAWLEGDKAGWRAEIRRVPYDVRLVEAGYRESGLLAAGGVMAEMFLRSIVSALPWVSDFVWWLRDQPAEALADISQAQRAYDAAHGPGRWAFPYIN